MINKISKTTLRRCFADNIDIIFLSKKRRICLIFTVKLMIDSEIIKSNFIKYSLQRLAGCKYFIAAREFFRVKTALPFSAKNIIKTVFKPAEV